MNPQVKDYLYLLIGLMLLLLSSCTFATDINELEREGGVEIRAWIGSQPDTQEKPRFSINEQVILTIEVATPRWFTGGTRIGSIEIPNVIAKQRNQLATNFTERIDGQTWSKQRWEITLHPQESGQFFISPVAVTVQVSASDGSNVKGTLYTKPLSFSASLPSGKLADTTRWFTATNVDVNQEWEASSQDLKVGDSITRTITVNADDSLSVLLPELFNDSSTKDYQTYLQPNVLKDTQARGNYRSSRTEQSIYVLQQGGEVSFPKLTLSWWNSKTKKLEIIEVEGASYQVKHTLNSFIKTYYLAIVLTATFITLVATVSVSLHKYYKTNPPPEWLTFHKAVRGGRWGEVRLALYRTLRRKNVKLELSKLHQTSTWQNVSDSVQSEEITSSAAYSARKSIRQALRRKKTSLVPKALPQLDRLSKPK
ncbi:hypothetical protein [Vibrio sp. TBV020]|uniref:hypothetical protein n=1 Tax=Vibrio sp. TBV020 TaxID=3137398 RepID=UPI0038CD9CC0